MTRILPASKGIDKHFTAVDLSSSSITSATIKALSACQSIHSLRLANTKISVADVAQLSKLESLSSLSLHSTEINSTALEVFEQNEVASPALPMVDQGDTGGDCSL